MIITQRSPLAAALLYGLLGGGVLGLSACTDHSTESSTISATASAGETLVELVNFDDEKQLAWLTQQHVETAVVGEDKQFAIRFKTDGHHAKVRIEPPQAWDFSAHAESNLAVDVKNNADFSTHIYMSLENDKGQLERVSVAVPAKFEGTVYLPLRGKAAETDAGLWGEAPPWPSDDTLWVKRAKQDDFDGRVIEAINFYTIGLLEERAVQIDNIRLRQNPEMATDWLAGIIDKYGQNAKVDIDMHVSSDQELRERAQDELAALAKSQGMPHRSRFGGYTKAPKLEATGYFRVEKVDGKWWMVDPDGYIFFSHGPANVRLANMFTTTGVDFKDDSIRVVRDDEVTPEDSIGTVYVPDSTRETRYILSDVRNQMFEWLPSYDDELADHYSYRRSTLMGPVKHGETFSFYRANLERRYGQSEPQSYLRQWERTTIDRMRDWGFTSFGNWVDPAFYDYEETPYFANGWIIGNYKTLSGHTNHWGLMPDFFDPMFAERAQATVKVVAEEVKGSPWCAGIFIDNEKSWGEREGSMHERYGVILDALSKNSAESPAKAAFSQHLKAKYDSIANLNNAWATNVESWKSFDAGATFDSYNEAHTADISKLLEMLGEQYFKVVHGALEEVLPNHLYMGARMANWGMPDEIIKASLKYSDVLSFNIYEEGVQASQWDFLIEVDKPVVIGEFHIGANDGSGMYNPGIVHAANQKDRAEMYKKYMASVIDKPYMVGAHWFEYIDEPVAGRAFDGENGNIGFVNTADIPYPLLVDAVKDVMGSLYQDRYGE